MLECDIFLYLTLFGNRKDTQFIQLMTLGKKINVCTRREKLYVAEEIYSRTQLSKGHCLLSLHVMSSSNGGWFRIGILRELQSWQKGCVHCLKILKSIPNFSTFTHVTRDDSMQAYSWTSFSSLKYRWRLWIHCFHSKKLMKFFVFCFFCPFLHIMAYTLSNIHPVNSISSERHEAFSRYPNKYLRLVQPADENGHTVTVDPGLAPEKVGRYSKTSSLVN